MSVHALNVGAKPAPAPARRTAVLVLGMHRSGTSTVAGALGILGAGLPKTGFGQRDDNPKGHFEPAAIVACHDRILASGGLRWWDWDHFPESWYDTPAAAPLIADLAETLTAEFGDAPLIVVKDPRICRLVPLWRRVAARLDLDLCAILPVRNPVDVARSIRRRDGFPTANALLAWLRYVLEAESESRGMPRVFLRYEDLLSDWQPVLGRTLERLHLRLPRQSYRARQELEEFIDPGLRNNRNDPAGLEDRIELHPWVKRAYELQSRLVDDASDREAIADLDRLRVEFDRACLAFTPALHGTQRGFEDAQARNGLIDPLQARADAAEAAAARVPALEIEAARVPALEAELAMLRRPADTGSATALHDLGARLGELTGAVAILNARLAAPRIPAWAKPLARLITRR